MSAGDVVLLVAALAPAPTTLMLAVELAVGLGTMMPLPAIDGEVAPLFTVVVPAHDEAAGISATIASIRADLRAGDRLLVVADNCSDATAALAAAAGAEVIQRHDPTRRGKGYALETGFAHPAVTATGVTLVVDADCRVEPGALPALAAAAARTNRPVQGNYQLTAPTGADGGTRFRAFAIRIKNAVRIGGTHRLGFPCILTGSGMAFPRPLLSCIRIGSGEIVEDLQMAVDLALAGHGAVFCAGAKITSPLPLDREAAARQRERWEGGFLSVARRYAGHLMVAGVIQRRPGLMMMGIDLAVPPLSLLAAVLAGLALLTLAAATAGASFIPATVALAQVTIFIAGVFAAWRAQGSDLISSRELLALPLRVIAKVPFYLRLSRTRNHAWVRTRRDELH